jgi:SAM-dependent methyltransferase
MATDSTLDRGWDAAYEENPDSQLWNVEPMPIVPGIVSRAGARGLSLGVDLGCGDGRNLLALRQGGLDVAGLDISATALRRANRLLRDHGDAAILLLGDVCALPFPDGSLDLVTALDVAGQVPDPLPLLAEARRVLRPGGLLVVNLFTPEDETYGEGEEVAPLTFRYRDTLFRYFESSELPEMFAAGWEIEVETATWLDPPHGSFRPRAHRHVNHVVWATAA